MSDQTSDGPWSNDATVRAGDVDRRRAVDALQAGYAEGALTLEEYEDRLAQAHTSGLTVVQLHELIDDLPAQREQSSPAPADKRAPQVAADQNNQAEQALGAVILAILAVVVVFAGARADSISIFGSIECEDACQISDPTATVDTVQIGGLSLFGSVEIVRPDEVDEDL